MAYAKKRTIRKIALSECKARKKIENNKKEAIKIEIENKEIEATAQATATATATTTEHGNQHRETNTCVVHEMGISKRKIEN